MNEETQNLLAVLQVVGTFVTILIFGVYVWQAVIMRRASQAQNILALVNFIQEETVRSARTIVRTTLKARTWPGWKYEEELKQAADKVCSSYDVTAIIIRKGLVPKEIIIENWKASIINCYEILHPYILEMQKPENSGPTYWDDFTWLYEESKSASDPLWKTSSRDNQQINT